MREITVLYAEDDLIIQKILGRFISKSYPSTLIAANGEEAFSLYNENKVDVIITDLAMPVMSGFELIRSIREKDARTPIIVTTAYREEARQLSSSNVTILYKPINTKELILSIDAALCS